MVPGRIPVPPSGGRLTEPDPLRPIEEDPKNHPPAQPVIEGFKIAILRKVVGQSGVEVLNIERLEVVIDPEVRGLDAVFGGIGLDPAGRRVVLRNPPKVDRLAFRRIDVGGPEQTRIPMPERR